MTEQEAIEAELIERELASRQQQGQPQQLSPAEQRIQSRPSAMADLIKNPPTSEHPLGAILRTLSGAAELYQGVPASIGLDLQQGQPQNILPNIGKVLTGQRPAQYGDIFKGAGVPEPLAAAGGLYSDIALSPGGAEGMVGLGKTAKTGVQALKGILKWDNELVQAQKSQAALETTRNILGKAKEIAINEIADVPAELNWGLNKSEKIVNAIKNPIYNVEFTPEGGVVNTVGNLDKVKEAVGDLLTPKMWEEAPKKEIAMIKQFYGNVVQSMKTAARQAGKPIDEALSKYENFMDNYKMVKKTIENAQGQAMGNKLKTTFNFLSEQAYKDSWKEVSKLNPEVKSIMNSMQRRSLLKDLLKVSLTYEGGKKVITGKF